MFSVQRTINKWQAINLKLPALIAALLCAAVGAASWSAYRALKTALLETTNERVNLAAQRFAATLEESAVRLRGDAARLAADDAVKNFLDKPTGSARAQLLARFDQHRAANPQVESVELLSPAGATLATSGRAPARHPTIVREASDSSPHRATVGPLVNVGGKAFVYLVAPVLDARHDTLAQVAQFRLVSLGAISALVAGLVGPDATLLLGNASGDGWTDLTRPVPAPTATTALNTVTTFRGSDGHRWLGVAESIRHTPWRVWIEVPQRSVLARARHLLLQIILISMAIVAIGALGGWLLSRRITAPLVDVTRAARDFAAGDYTRRAPTGRDDELGELAASFNDMARQVQDSTTQLERNAGDLASANHELRDSEARYRKLVELLPDGMIVHVDGTLIFANDAAARLLGAESPRQLIGRQVLDFVPHNFQPVVRDMIARNQSGVATPLAERTLQRLDRAPVTVEMLGLPFVYDELAGAQTIIRDVTARKHLEQALAQSQKMEAVGRLAGGIAHDFNNILTVISSYCALTLDTLESTSPIREDIEEIRSASSRAADLTRQLLAFSRKQMLQPVPLNLNETVGGVDKMLRRLIGEDIDLVASCAADLDTVSADPGQIEQVIVNLAVNARDAMPDGGRLTIETANVELSGTDGERQLGVPPGRYVMLKVTDTGVGMSQETLERIFEPFFTTKEPGKGTGLGLSTVYGIVKQSGGDISVCSAPGGGASFKIYLPSIGGADLSAAAVEQEETALPGTETLLLVEDDAAVRSVTARVLRHAGYRVVEAGTDEEALDVCRKPAPKIHLILTDLVMPGMGGRELARELQQRRPNVRVLFMSGYTEDSVLRHRFLDREAAFIGKPFTPEGLTSKVRELLDAA